MSDRQEILNSINSFNHQATLAAYVVKKLDEGRISSYLDEIEGENYNHCISVSLRYLSD